MATFSRPGAGGQFPAFGEGQFDGCVEGVRIGPVAVDEREVGSSPPDRPWAGVEHFAQVGGLLALLLGDRRGTIKHGARYERLAELPAGAQQQSTQNQRDNQVQRPREFDHGYTPYFQ